MIKNRKFNRYSSGKHFDFHGPDRMRFRNAISTGDFDDLPIRESIRMPLWRGPNGFGDDTSFGYNSGAVSHDYYEKLLKKYIGKTFEEYYSAMCMIFKGYDRYELNRFVFWEFKASIAYGYSFRDKYEIVDGFIVLNED